MQPAQAVEGPPVARCSTAAVGLGPLLAGSSAGVDADELRVGRAVQALDGNDHLLFDSQTGQLFFDADGTGPLARMVVAQLVGLVGTLDASDFTLEMPAGV